MSAIELIESRPRNGRRWWWLVAAAVLGVAAAVFFLTRPAPHSTAEPSPKAEGYQEVGSTLKVTFWVKVFGDNQVGVRTTGRLGGICNNLGPYTAVLGPVPVCAESQPAQGSVFAYVLPSTTQPKTLSLTDGEALDPASSFGIGEILRGQKLVVYLLPPTNQIVTIANGN